MSKWGKGIHSVKLIFVNSLLFLYLYILSDS
jgi:hypothetical protein